ncbi:MAG: CHC2 zinc finger domain-containing protein, partial [Candidatus Kaiserbacteria bacterium]|nr:CHC2 zinc finger domain-containing protein [Candidatus Kaiserbacteria bacterium]
MTTTEALQLFESHLEEIKNTLAEEMLSDIVSARKIHETQMYWLRFIAGKTGTPLMELLEELKRQRIEQMIEKKRKMIQRIVTYLTPVSASQAVGRITDEMIERAKAFPIEELYDGELRKGTGLCPFHNEKTSSFHIFKDNRWRCFGACGTGGDSISFYMKANGKGFK